jgi:4,5-dihydroxyphthalate decarboxylase
VSNIKMAVGDRLETKFFLSGRVNVAGFDINFHNPGPVPAPIFNDMVTTMPYDVGELTIANYVVAKDQGVPLIGLPVFPNLFFPLTGVTINTGAGIKSPGDLAGKRVGVPLGFASNPAVWLRGVLSRQFNVPSESITWVVSDRDSLAGIDYPRSPGFKSDKSADLDKALDAGGIDALVVAGGNSEQSPNVELLVTDPYPLLQSYFDGTGTFPINTMLVMKRDSVATYPGLSDAVVAASGEARTIYDAEEPDDGIHQGLRVGDLRRMGLFPRNHGLGVHGKSVENLVSYLHEQGIIRKQWSLADLFV